VDDLTRLITGVPDNDVIVGTGVLVEMVQSLRAEGWRPARHGIVVVDDLVAQLWPELAPELAEALLDNSSIVKLSIDLESKDFGRIASLIEILLAAGVRRDSFLVAVGGGTVSDLVGFISSILFRGVRRIIVPTTLLAQVDAAIGNKTGVDYESHKNLLGSFSYPALVLCTTRLLRTLPFAGLTDGLAEIVKVAVIDGPELFAKVAAFSFFNFTHDDAYAVDLIRSAAQAKLRQLHARDSARPGLHPLDLGHTLGHAIERLPARRLSHGMAVGIDLATSTRLALAHGKLAKAPGEAILWLLKRLGITVSIASLDEAEHEFIQRNIDQIQRLRGATGLVVPTGIGSTAIIDHVSVAELLHYMCEAHEPG
jgi:3-dehydroquinate synthase